MNFEELQALKREVEEIKFERESAFLNVPFGTFLKQARLRTFYTQRDIAFELGVSYQTYQYYEYGIYKPKPQRLKLIATLLGFSYEFAIHNFYL